MGKMCPTVIMNTQNLQGGLGHLFSAPMLVYGRKVFVAALLGHPGHDATHHSTNRNITLGSPSCPAGALKLCKATHPATSSLNRRKC